MIWWRLPSVVDEEAKITIDLSKTKAESDLYHSIKRIMEFYDKHLPQDIWKYPIVMHTFIPKNRD
jgi:hypothetical protein